MVGGTRGHFGNIVLRVKPHARVLCLIGTPKKKKTVQQTDCLFVGQDLIAQQRAQMRGDIHAIKELAVILGTPRGRARAARQ